MAAFIASLILATVPAACAEDSRVQTAQKSEQSSIPERVEPMTEIKQISGGRIPEELEQIPAEYETLSEHAGTLEKLEYETWESFS